jgi:hypothetical protein
MKRRFQRQFRQAARSKRKTAPAFRRRGGDERASSPKASGSAIIAPAIIADIMQPNGKIYLRPEFGRIGKHWPCIAFRLMPELLKLVDVYEDGDLVLGTGTVNAENTREPTYRGKNPHCGDHQAAIFSYTGNRPVRELGSPLPQHGGEAQWPHCLPALRIFKVGKEQSPCPQANHSCQLLIRHLSAPSRPVSTILQIDAAECPSRGLRITSGLLRNHFHISSVEDQPQECKRSIETAAIRGMSA